MTRKSAKQSTDSGQADEAPNPTAVQLKWLSRGLRQAGGKLPLFDENGKRISDRTVKSCVAKGWAEPWFENPIKPSWLICKLTDTGRRLASG